MFLWLLHSTASDKLQVFTADCRLITLIKLEKAQVFPTMTPSYQWASKQNTRSLKWSSSVAQNSFSEPYVNFVLLTRDNRHSLSASMINIKYVSLEITTVVMNYFILKCFLQYFIFTGSIWSRCRSVVRVKKEIWQTIFSNKYLYWIYKHHNTQWREKQSHLKMNSSPLHTC